MDEKYMTAPEAARYVGLSESYLAKLRMDTAPDAGPKFLRIGQRTIRYRAVDLDEWMRSMLCGTSACSGGSR
jgi:predicted DNA-binding transcriptional regulator AlpA